MKIYAFIGYKPKGRAPNRYWPAFSFNTEIQSHVEDFMMSIHCKDYWLHAQSSLKKKTKHGITHYYYTKNKEYGEVWVYDTPVSVCWEKCSCNDRNGHSGKRKVFKIRH